jgi:NADPH-dependent 2,4-dienoyl-CoA reductase/sulfur reductase-like enzyme
VVVGGGLGGMEAALMAAQRGHDVSLYEKEDKLGGQWNILASYRPEVSSITNYLSRELSKTGAKVHYGTLVDAEFVKKLQPDAVIIATGARQKLPDIPGVHGETVLLANDVLSGKAGTGKQVVVLGGGLVGMEAAVFLAKQGKKVSLVDVAEIGNTVGYTLKEALIEDMLEYGVYQYSNVIPDEITRNGLTVMMYEEFVLLKADTVVVAVGSESCNDLYGQLKGTVPELHVIGDSREPRNSFFAIHEGFKVGNLIPMPVDADFEDTLRG